MQVNEGFIKRVIPTATIHSTPPSYLTISIDTRTLQRGEVFLAIKGQHEDGHQYIQDALKSGAAGLIIEHDQEHLLNLLSADQKKSIWICSVPDTTQALIDLATAWRKQFSMSVVCITGSVGKTSTKELIINMLHRSGIAYCASFGNQNTKIGLALSLLKIRQEHAVCVFELGISKRGEMRTLVEMAQPTVGVITSIAHCHMEGLGSLHDIAYEKRQIFSLFKENNIGIINGDIPLLAQVAYNHPMIKFGSKTINQVQARKICTKSASFTLKLYGKRHCVTLKTNHTGTIFNALAAASVGYLLNIPLADIVHSIEQPLTIAGRFESRPLKIGKGILINDCYNANPESMKASLLAFQDIDTSAEKIAIIGDMLELGVNTPFWHRQLGRFLRKTPSLKKIILVGSHVRWIQKTAPLGSDITLVETWQEVIDLLKEQMHKEALVLIKGSLGVGLKHVVESFS